MIKNAIKHRVANLSTSLSKNLGNYYTKINEKKLKTVLLFVKQWIGVNSTNYLVINEGKKEKTKRNIK